LPIAERDIRDGLKNAFIPGRFEIVKIDDVTTVVFDGAHTPASAQVLTNAISSRYPDHDVSAIVAMLADKEPLAFLEPLLSIVDTWVVSQPQTPRALATNVLLSALSQLGGTAEASESIGEGLSQVMSDSRRVERPRVILVTGSLSTVAEARSALGLDASQV
jgi:dihydrofolate synthase/folylpolyglutamate synthase